MMLLGAGIALLCAAANAVALVLQAGAVREPGTASRGLLLTLARRPRWVAGTALVAIAWPGQIVALAFAPLTVVQPMLATFGLILLGLARTQLGETVGPREVLGATGIAAGVTVLLLAAPRHAVLQPSALRLGACLVPLGGGLVLTVWRNRGTRTSSLHRSNGTVEAKSSQHPRPRSPGSAGAAGPGSAGAGPGGTGAGPGAAGAAGETGCGLGRATNRGLGLAIAAGLGYAWADLVDKLVADDFSRGRVAVGLIWLITVMIAGAVALNAEQHALQRRPASSVGPLVGSIQEPLPVLLALLGGLEVWPGGAVRAIALAVGIGLVGAGAASIARSPAAARFAQAQAAAEQTPELRGQSLESQG